MISIINDYKIAGKSSFRLVPPSHRNISSGSDVSVDSVLLRILSPYLLACISAGRIIAPPPLSRSGAIITKLRFAS